MARVLKLDWLQIWLCSRRGGWTAGRHQEGHTGVAHPRNMGWWLPTGQYFVNNNVIMSSSDEWLCLSGQTGWRWWFGRCALSIKWDKKVAADGDHDLIALLSISSNVHHFKLVCKVVTGAFYDLIIVAIFYCICLFVAFFAPGARKHSYIVKSPIVRGCSYIT